MNIDAKCEQLPSAVELHAEALRAASPEPQQVERAQHLLLDRLTRVTPRTGWLAPRRALMAGAAAGIVAVLGLLLVPAFVTRPAVAFADVQRHFSEFGTLRMGVETSAGTGPVMHTQVWVDHAGSVRVDVDRTLTVVVNVERREVLSLLHDAKAAMVRPLVAGEIKREDALKWLDELRAFRGQATPLPDTRVIDGMTAHGFALQIGGLDCTLWASDDGLPLAMTLNQGSLLDQRFQFTFDPPADPARFATDIPAGYHRLEGEAD